MDYYIRITPFGMERFEEGRTQGFRLQLRVDEVVNVDPNIFVYQIKTFPGFPLTDFSMVNIASPSDIEEYPVGIPTDLNAVDISPFFRLSTADLIFRSAQAVDEALVRVDQDVAGLIEALTLMDKLTELPAIEHGTPPTSSSSSSSSS